MARREPWARSFDDNGDFEPMAEINVTPMVDVMLVRLIIFMVAGMPVNLPQTAAAKQNPPQKPLVITIAANAKYYIRNEEVRLKTWRRGCKRFVQPKATPSPTYARTKASAMEMSWKSWDVSAMLAMD